MANPKHVEILKSGVERWNKWREENPDVVPDLGGAELREANLDNADFSYADISYGNLSRANLRGAIFHEADMCKADLRDAILTRAFFGRANLSEVDFRGAYLAKADFSEADLSEADLRKSNLQLANLWAACFRSSNLRGAYLEQASFVETDLRGTQLDGCSIYGASVWGVEIDSKTSQRDLVIAPYSQDTITVDNIKVAQFVYLLLNNKEIRNVIDTVAKKLVLILGRFTEKRKRVLDAIRNELRKRNYLPVLFDFDKPDSRDLTETISTLAHMARFVIADITDAKSIPQELQKIVPNLPSLPVRPIILDGQYEYAMFRDFGGYPSVLPPYRYQDTNDLLESLKEEVIGPALTKAEEIAERRKAFEAELGKRS